jgi:fatty-acid desaturase
VNHGHLWWEFDSTYLLIRLLAEMGLACDLAMPTSSVARERDDPRHVTGMPVLVSERS